MPAALFPSSQAQAKVNVHVLVRICALSYGKRLDKVTLVGLLRYLNAMQLFLLSDFFLPTFLG